MLVGTEENCSVWIDKFIYVVLFLSFCNRDNWDLPYEILEEKMKFIDNINFI